MEKPCLFFVAALTLVAATSCSSFHEQWRQAASQSTPEDFTGRWEGRWVSTATGHEGKLRCLVTPSEDPQTHGHYNFHYWARWGFLSGAFATVYPVRETAPGAWRFEGESDLGFLGGLYRHQGSTTGRAFDATYTATNGDRGRMQMRRPNDG